MELSSIWSEAKWLQKHSFLMELRFSFAIIKLIS